MKKEFSKAEEDKKEVDLNPNKRYNGFDALVDVSEYMRANFIRKKLQQHQQQQQQQQLSHPSPMITGEKGNQCFSGKNAVDNACKENDISIPPNKVRPNEEVLDISKVEKKMAMTSRRVISSMSESPEGMSWEEFLTKERLLKRLKEIEEENMMQVKRDCKKVVRFEDSNYDSEEECRVRKTQKRSSKRSDPSLMITCEECNQYFSGQNTRKPLAIDNACKKKDISIPKNARTKEAVLDISKLEKKLAMTSTQRVISNKPEYSEGMSREEVLRRERLLKRSKEIEEENIMQTRVKRDCKRVVRFEDSDYASKEEYQVKKTQKRKSNTHILFEAVREFTKFLETKDFERLIDLDPSKTYTDGDVLVATAKAFKAHFKSEKLPQQLSGPSPMITGEEGNQYFSGQNAKKPLAIDNACKKKDISIPKKARTKEAVFDISKLEKKMAMTSQRVINNKSEFTEGMPREEILRRERLLKRPKEIEEENDMQKGVKRDCKRVVRFEDFDSDSEEEYQVKKTQKMSSKARIIFEAVKEFVKFLKAKDVEKLIDLDPNKTYTDGDVLVASAKAYIVHIKREKLQQQLSDPSFMITGEEGNATQLSGSKSVPRGTKLSLQGFMSALDASEAAKTSTQGRGRGRGRGSSKLKQTTLDAAMVVRHSGRSALAAATASGQSIATEEENLDSASSDEAVEYGVDEVQESSDDDENLSVKGHKRTAPTERGRASGSTAKRGRKSDNTSSSSIQKILVSKDDEDDMPNRMPESQTRVTRNYGALRR